MSGLVIEYYYKVLPGGRRRMAGALQEEPQSGSATAHEGRHSAE